MILSPVGFLISPPPGDEGGQKIPFWGLIGDFYWVQRCFLIVRDLFSGFYTKKKNQFLHIWFQAGYTVNVKSHFGVRRRKINLIGTMFINADLKSSTV